MIRDYASAGVDYRRIDPFKSRMAEMGRRTLAFPNRRGVYVEQGAHGALFEYRGPLDHCWCTTQEGLGNKNWIAEWMYAHSGTGDPYYRGIAVDTALMAVNDLIAQGAMPCVYTDEVAAGDSEWFADDRRAEDFADGFYDICALAGMALPAGESPSLKYLVRSHAPVRSAPVLSGSAVGMIAPRTSRVGLQKISAGDVIIGVESSGLHANGISLLIETVMSLPEQFLTRMPDGKTVGEDALTPTRSYVALVEALLDAEIPITAFLPGTGSGVAKLATRRDPLTYRIHDWTPNIPQLFRFMLEQGIDLASCLGAFNWGIGYYIFAPEKSVSRILRTGEDAGYALHIVGRVEDGPRRVIFEPESIVLPPPGE